MLLRSSAFILLALIALSFASGQDDQATFRSDTRLVVLYASVVDSKGRLVTDLPKQAFKVFENGA